MAGGGGEGRRSKRDVEGDDGRRPRAEVLIMGIEC